MLVKLQQVCVKGQRMQRTKSIRLVVQQFNNWLNRVHGEMDQKEEEQRTTIAIAVSVTIFIKFHLKTVE